MDTITIQLPKGLLVATGESSEEFVREAKLLLALKLFELGRISSGKAAEVAGMSRVDFLFSAGRYGVSVFQVDEDEVEEEFGRV